MVVLFLWCSKVQNNNRIENNVGILIHIEKWPESKLGLFDSLAEPTDCCVSSGGVPNGVVGH